MCKQLITRLLLIPLVGVLMIALPAVSQATSVTSIKVTVGSTTYCDTSQSGCTFTIWNLSGGVNLATGALMLTQNQPGVGAGGFDFDTSDLLATTAVPTITIGTTAGTFMFSDTGQILSTPRTPGVTDPLTTGHQEAVDWTSVGTTGGIQLWLGYADNAHSGSDTGGLCGDADKDCLPGTGSATSPWQGTPGTTFLGNPFSSTAGCIRTGITSCFDAGALRIEQVSSPEPSALILLGFGLLGMFYVIQRQSKIKTGIR
jgi:hypothetical protein